MASAHQLILFRRFRLRTWHPEPCTRRATSREAFGGPIGCAGLTGESHPTSQHSVELGSETDTLHPAGIARCLRSVTCLALLMFAACASRSVPLAEPEPATPTRPLGFAEQVRDAARQRDCSTALRLVGEPAQIRGLVWEVRELLAGLCKECAETRHAAHEPDAKDYAECATIANPNDDEARAMREAILAQLYHAALGRGECARASDLLSELAAALHNAPRFEVYRSVFFAKCVDDTLPDGRVAQHPSEDDPAPADPEPSPTPTDTAIPPQPSPTASSTPSPFRTATPTVPRPSTSTVAPSATPTCLAGLSAATDRKLPALHCFPKPDLEQPELKLDNDSAHGAIVWLKSEREYCLVLGPHEKPTLRLSSGLYRIVADTDAGGTRLRYGGQVNLDKQTWCELTFHGPQH